MPALAPQVLGSVPGAATVVPAAWSPSAVLVHLGTNDFCCDHPLELHAFVAAYVELLLNMTATRLGGSKVAAAASPTPPPVFAACNSGDSHPVLVWLRSAII
eukprot:4346058-Prymnesium_polylepis.1